MFNVSLRVHKPCLFSIRKDFVNNIQTVIGDFKLEFCPCGCISLDVPWLRNMNLSWSKNSYTRLPWLMKGKPQKFIVRVQIIIHNLMCTLKQVRQRIAYMIHKAFLSNIHWLSLSHSDCTTLVVSRGKAFFGPLLSENTEYVNCRRKKCWRKLT